MRRSATRAAGRRSTHWIGFVAVVTLAASVMTIAPRAAGALVPDRVVIDVQANSYIGGTHADVTSFSAVAATYAPTGQIGFRIDASFPDDYSTGVVHMTLTPPTSGPAQLTT